jgi:hypothetical protein
MAGGAVTATTQLVTLEEATRMLAACRTVNEAKGVRDLAEAARVYAREAELGFEAQNYAAEIRLRAERRLGDILIEMAEEGARRTQATAKSNDLQSLDNLRIEPHESSRWQRLANMSRSDFEDYLKTAKAEGQPITLLGALRTQIARQSERYELIAADQGRRFVIYNALQALACCPDTPKRWTRLPHGASARRVDDWLEEAVTWLTGLEEAWKHRDS